MTRVMEYFLKRACTIGLLYLYLKLLLIVNAQLTFLSSLNYLHAHVQMNNGGIFVKGSFENDHTPHPTSTSTLLYSFH